LGNPNQQSSSQETEGFFLVADAVVAVVAVAGAAVAAACAFGLAPVCVTRQIFVWPLPAFLKLEY